MGTRDLPYIYIYIYIPRAHVITDIYTTNYALVRSLIINLWPIQELIGLPYGFEFNEQNILMMLCSNSQLHHIQLTI